MILRAMRRSAGRCAAPMLLGVFALVCAEVVGLAGLAWSF